MKKTIKAVGFNPVMVRVQRQPLTPARLVRPLVVLCAVFYLCFNAMHGERGLYALIREQRELRETNAELVQTKDARQHIELKVTHLRDGSLDLDLLDEQMRRMLGVMKKGEVVVLPAN